MKLGLIFIFILLSLLFIGGPNYQDGRLIKELWETGHFILFAIIIFFLLQTPSLRERHYFILLFFTGTFSLLFGLSTELLQLMVGRSFSLKDIFNDIIGGYAGFTAAMLYFQIKNSVKLTTKNYSLYFISIIILSTIGARSFLLVVFDELKMRSELPQLANFEQASELNRWSTFFARMSISDEYVKLGEHSLKFTLIPHRYSDITMDSFVGNWENFEKINFDLYNPQNQTVSMVVKIFDQQHPHNHYRFLDRFNQRITVNPGWNEFSFPITDIINAPENRINDIKNIRNFSLFTIDIKNRMTFYLDDLRLVKSSPLPMHRSKEKIPHG